MSGKTKNNSGAAVSARRTNKGKRSSFKRRNIRRLRNRNLNYTRKLVGEVGQTQTFKCTKREVWFTGSFAAGNQLTAVKKKFDITTGPAWFKQMAMTYEKYKLHGVNLYVKFGGSAMTKGIYVLTYNANESAFGENKTFEQYCCQKGSQLVPAARQSGSIHINGSSLTGYSTTLPTEGTGTYSFNAILAGVPVEAVDYIVEVQYVVTFYNPTIRE